MYVYTLYSTENTTYQKGINYCAGLICEVGLSALGGYLVSKIFTLANPLHGTIFCIVSTLVSKVTSPLFNYLLNNKHANGAVKLLTGVISIIISAAFTAAITTIIGFPISLPGALAFTMVVINAYLITTVCLLVLGVALR